MRLDLRNVRRILVSAFALVLGLALAPRLHAQGPGGGGRMDPAARMQQRMEMMTQRLQLTPAQVEQLKPILQHQSEEMQELFQKANGDFQSMRPEMQKLREKNDKEVEAILTDAQKKEYEAMQAEMRSRRGGGGGRQR